MNNDPTQTQIPAGKYISETAVRGVFSRRRRTSPTTSTEPATARRASLPTDGQHASQSQAGQRPLRRWSVAELIARAFAAPGPDGISHGYR